MEAQSGGVYRKVASTSLNWFMKIATGCCDNLSEVDATGFTREEKACVFCNVQVGLLQLISTSSH